MPTATVHLRVYFSPTRVVSAPRSAAAGDLAADAAVELSVNAYTAHLRPNLVISGGSSLPTSSSASTLRDVNATLLHNVSANDETADGRTTVNPLSVQRITGQVKYVPHHSL